MAVSTRALAGLARCDPPPNAALSASVVQPGRFAHGPEEKFGFAGFTAGAVRGISAMATLPGRKPHVRVRCPEAANTPACGRTQEWRCGDCHSTARSIDPLANPSN